LEEEKKHRKSIGKKACLKMAFVPDIDLYADDLEDDFHGVIIRIFYLSNV
jgi:hypothetical protein